ncbi:UDP-N-acetylmuramoyl-tripeptide--D-alanyl-D-alanine ligase [hydrothermal vent metagenome]|uniref:UDP-MurNAc-pentapeptide synthetase n=1 Tax=hydrothermal vent metagenome TaxID=652676 RepID=A0A3B0ZLP0_9ZZZZ
MALASRETFSLLQLAQLCGGELRGGDLSFSALSIDSRTINNGDLFVALRGPNFDGHAFVSAAQQAGAVALLVEHAVDSELPQVIVSDSHHALGELASAWRMQYPIPVIAVTGSNGKTSVKEMLASILGQQGEVLATKGNFNNDIGVPLTLMRINSKHRYAVIEMGANHHGEIRYLTNLAKPTVAMVNNAGPSHLEGFGDVAGVARAKGEIFEGLQKGGVAVINADDKYTDVWQLLCAEIECKHFGIDKEADVSATDLVRVAGTSTGAGYCFKLHVGAQSIEISLPLPGRHNVMNALAASAAAMAAGATLNSVRDGLQSLVDVGGRLQIKKSAAGVTVIDDTYNANPASLQAGLDVLNESDGEKILVLADMGELGDLAVSLHRQMGEQAGRAGVKRLFTIGNMAQHTAQAFGAAANHFTTQDVLISELRRALTASVPPVTVMVKGSRSMKMERVVAALLDDEISLGGVDKDVVYARAVGAGS